ncbi:hypothetical protein pb186bvf_003388 [Paramecium bursaria]
MKFISCKPNLFRKINKFFIQQQQISYYYYKEITIVNMDKKKSTKQQPQKQKSQVTKVDPNQELQQWNEGSQLYLGLLYEELLKKDCTKESIKDFVQELQILRNQITERMISQEGINSEILDQVLIATIFIDSFQIQYQDIKKDKEFQEFKKSQLYELELFSFIKKQSNPQKQEQIPIQKVEVTPQIDDFQKHQIEFQKKEPDNANPFFFGQVANFDETPYIPPPVDEIAIKKVESFQEPNVQQQAWEKADNTQIKQEPDVKQTWDQPAWEQPKVQSSNWDQQPAWEQQPWNAPQQPQQTFENQFGFPESTKEVPIENKIEKTIDKPTKKNMDKGEPPQQPIPIPNFETPTVKPKEKAKNNPFGDSDIKEEEIIKQPKLQKQLSGPENKEFDQFSKYFNNNVSGYKSPDGENEGNAPFSNIFDMKIGDLNDSQINLENMVGSMHQTSQRSIQAKSKSKSKSKSRDDQSQINAFEIKKEDFPKDWEARSQQESREIVEKNRNNSYEQQKQETPQWNLDNYYNQSTRLHVMDDQGPQNDQNFDQNQNQEQHNFQNVIQKFDFQQDYDFPQKERQSNYFGNLPKLAIYKMDQISINNLVSKNKKQMIHQHIQTQEFQVQFLKYDPQQEINHQNEKRQIMLELNELKNENNNLNYRIQQLEKENQYLNDQFVIYRTKEQKQSQAYKYVDQQYKQLSQAYKDIKTINDDEKKQNLLLCEENVKLSKELSNQIQDNNKALIQLQSLQTSVCQISKQFKDITANHKCPIQQFLSQFFNKVDDQNTNNSNIQLRTSVQNIPEKRGPIKRWMEYEPSRFLEFLRQCAQLNSNNVDDLKYAILFDKAILFQDKQLQIGFTSKRQGEQKVECVIYVINKTTEDLQLKDINFIQIQQNQSNQFPSKCPLQKRGQFKFNLQFTYQETSAPPIIEFTLNNKYQIVLPIMTFKFLFHQQNDRLTLEKKWKENKMNNIIISSKLESLNPRFISKFEDFQRYFQQSVKLDNTYLQYFKLENTFEIGLKIKQKQNYILLKTQSSEFVGDKAESILQEIMFIFQNF